MNREKLAWSASAALLAVLAFQIPGTLAQRDDDYAFVRTLVDIHRRVADNYVDPVDEPKLNQGAIDGMLDQLDPFSVFVPPEREDDFDRMLSGNFKGVGIRFDQHPDGTFEIVTPVDGSPAAASGIQPGDMLLAVDGKSLENVRLIELPAMVGGPLGTPVTLTVRHPDGQQASYTLTRAEVHQPTVKGYRRNAGQQLGLLRLRQPQGRVRPADAVHRRVVRRAAGRRRAAAGRRHEGADPGPAVQPRRRAGAGRADHQHARAQGPDDPDHPRPGPARAPGRVRRAGRAAAFPMIVLVNEHSASAAEIVSGSLMDNGRAVVLGQRTYGKGSVQEVIPLAEAGGELKLTVAYYYLPSGRLVHRRKDATDWGVQPQITVPMDAAAEQRVLQRQDEADVFRRPPPKAVTRPTPARPRTQPTDDAQLQAAVNTMLGVLVFGTEPPATTRPATP